jgi:hypothetical protein
MSTTLQKEKTVATDAQETIRSMTGMTRPVFAFCETAGARYVRAARGRSNRIASR